jgi:hypothetical protein
VSAAAEGALRSQRGGSDYRGWSIAHDQPESALFGDGPTEGVDLDASGRRYCELLTDALEAEFPGAEIAVRMSDRSGLGITCPPGTDHEEFEAARVTARALVERVWGERDWYVDRLYSQAQFALALAEAFPAKKWNTETVGSYRTRGLAGIPEPKQYVGNHPAWTWSQVQEYIASRRSPEIVTVSEVFSQDPEAKPFVVSYHARDGMPAHASQAFETLDAARASVPARFELQAPGPDADGDVILVGRTRLGAVGARTSDQSFALATHRLLADLEAAGHQVETPATGAVIIDGHEVAGERFEVLAMGWARGEYDEIGDLVDEITEEEEA